MSRLLTAGVIASRVRRWADPLAGISFALRLQTHRGDGVPLGLFQDVDELVPAIEDGDPVAVWRDVLSGSGLAAVQTVSTKRPTLRFTGGIPWLDFDGVDDWMSIGNFAGQVTYAALIRSNVSTWNNYFSIIDTAEGEEPPGYLNRWGCFQAGTTNLWADPPVAAGRKNGVPLASPSANVAPINEWSVFSFKTHDSTGDQERGIFQMEQTYYGNARVIALGILAGNPAIDSAGVITSEDYFQTLAPA